jgi:nucleoside-diphosphate-sugar epimerase
MKVLVTGAAGFVGRNLVERLSSVGLEITAVDSLDPILYPARIKQHNLHYISKLPGVKTLTVDITNPDLPKEILNCEVVVNLAALPGQLLSWERVVEYNKSNYLSVSNLLSQFAKSGKFPRWIQASTSSVYGKEATGGESAPCEPCNPYGVTKLAAEKQLYAYSSYFEFPFVILRYFSLYGPFQRPDMGIAKFFKCIEDHNPLNIYGDGTQTRDLTYISDAVDATCSALTYSSSSNEIFNISGGGIYSALEIARSCVNVTGKSSSIEFVDRPIGDQLNTFGNSQKAKVLLGFTPKVSLEEGLEHQWKSYLDSRWLFE